MRAPLFVFITLVAVVVGLLIFGANERNERCLERGGAYVKKNFCISRDGRIIP